MNTKKDVPDEALKNCSRCNKPAKGEFYKDSSSRTMYEVACVDRAYCQNETHSKYPHRAITAWNKRLIEDALNARIEELETQAWNQEAESTKSEMAYIKNIERLTKREDIMVAALAEIKATNDGNSHQPISSILQGCIDELHAIEQAFKEN